MARQPNQPESKPPPRVLPGLLPAEVYLVADRHGPAAVRERVRVLVEEGWAAVGEGTWMGDRYVQLVARPKK